MAENNGSHSRRSPWPVIRFVLIIAVAVAAVYLLIGYPLPYFILKPGTAEVTRPMVHIPKPYKKEKGVLMLTTVRVEEANAVNYVLAKMNSLDEIQPRKAIMGASRSQSGYNNLENYMMQDSQSNAMEAAYRAAKVPFHIKEVGVEVLLVMKGMPADGKLKAGDFITKIDNTTVKDYQSLVKIIQSKKAGDTIDMTYQRGGEEQVTRIKLAKLPGTTHPGVGVQLGQIMAVKANDPDKQIKVNAGNIGGPSAGLMFSLEMYNQLTPGDLTKGYRIAGTGEIDAKGNVSVIGGIQHKIVAANRQKATIFFAPKDWHPTKAEAKEGYQPVLNTTDAKKMVKKLHAPIKVISVSKMQDALNYLKQLPAKPAASGK